MTQFIRRGLGPIFRLFRSRSKKSLDYFDMDNKKVEKLMAFQQQTQASGHFTIL